MGENGGTEQSWQEGRVPDCAVRAKQGRKQSPPLLGHFFASQMVSEHLAIFSASYSGVAGSKNSCSLHIGHACGQSWSQVGLWGEANRQPHFS